MPLATEILSSPPLLLGLYVSMSVSLCLSLYLSLSNILLVLGERERQTERVTGVQALGSITKLEGDRFILRSSMRRCVTAVDFHGTPSPGR
jgi:hypothetical protein